MRGEYRDGERVRTVEVTPEGGGAYRVTVDGATLSFTAEPLDDGRLRLVTPEGVVIAEVTAVGTRRFVRLGALDFVLEREAGRARRPGQAVGGGLESPMPGVVTQVLVEAGAGVRRGQPLVAVEAMKMEHLVRAPRDGVVSRVLAQAGAMVEAGARLVELEEAEGGA